MAAEVFNDDHVGPAVMPEDVEASCDNGCNYVTCKEDLEYEELCTLEGMIALFNHDATLDKEITNLKEDCLLKTIHDLEERTSDVLTLMFYVKSEKVPADKVDALLKEAIKNPMSLLEYIDEADKSKYDINMLRYVEDVEGEW